MQITTEDKKQIALDDEKRKMLEDIMNNDVRIEDDIASIDYDALNSADIYSMSFNATNYNKVKENLRKIGQEIAAYVLLSEGKDVKIDDKGNYYLEEVQEEKVTKKIKVPDDSRYAKFLRKIRWEDRTLEKTITETTQNVIQKKLPERNVNHFVKLIKRYCNDLALYNKQIEELMTDIESKEEKLDGDLYTTINKNIDLLNYLVESEEKINKVKQDIETLEELKQGVSKIDKNYGDIKITLRKKRKLLSALKGQYVNSARRHRYQKTKEHMLEKFSNSLEMTKTVAKRIYNHNECIIDVFSSVQPAISYIHDTANLVGKSLNVIYEADKGIKKFLEITNMAEQALSNVAFKNTGTDINEIINDSNKAIEATVSNIDAILDEEISYVHNQL